MKQLVLPRFLFPVLFLVLSGCSTLSISPADDPVPRGVRVYPPRVYLLVDSRFGEGRGLTTLLTLPNYAEAYDIRPVTVFSRNDFRIQVEDGMLKSLQSDQDTTAALALFKTAGVAAASAAGVGVSARDFEGSYGLETGIYILQPDGTFKKTQ